MCVCVCVTVNKNYDEYEQNILWIVEFSIIETVINIRLNT